MKLKFGIYFCDDEGEKFFGEGAYTKAFGILKRAEDAFAFPLTQRKIGGRGGGGSMLTPGAKELLMRYEAYKTSCTQMAESLYNTHFSTFRPEKPAYYRR